MSGGLQTVFLGFIPATHLPGDDATEEFRMSRFKRDDSTLDKALVECNMIRQCEGFSEGLLLKCIEHKPMFSFLHYATFRDELSGAPALRVNSLVRELDVSQNKNSAAYEEIFGIQKALQATETSLPSSRHAGFVVTCFKIMDKSFKQQALEKSWLSWTGAREIYKYSPRTWNLRRITLHRHSFMNGKNDAFAYVMLCEFGNILHPSNALQALDMCERLRARNCGHIALYQVQYSYGAAPPFGLSAPEHPLPRSRNTSPWASPSMSPRRSPPSHASSPVSAINTTQRRRMRNLSSMGYSQDVDTAHASSVRRSALLRMRDRSLGYDLDPHQPFHSYHQLEEIA
ncbi:Protein H10D18.5 [Aphelenchoides avenae]|nr:Protein H10D18.5 [Aphelenchus avenae]